MTGRFLALALNNDPTAMARAAILLDMVGANDDDAAEVEHVEAQAAIFEEQHARGNY